MSAAFPIRAAVLDMDGLILDTEPMSQAGWVRTFRERGIPFDDRQFHALVGLSAANARRKMLGWYGPEFPFEEIYSRKLECVDEIIAAQGIPLKPGLAEFLSAVDALGLRKAVATSTARERAIYKLGIAGMSEAFPVVAGGDEVAHGKPAPDLFLLAAKRLGIPPGECLAFEDSDPGALAARAAGMRVVIIPDQKRPSPEASAAAWRVLPDLRQAAANLPVWVRGEL
ncbi:MAG: HAD family phosphatase [Anaerolineales bacterium]|nr:HAD family phosphatase [Anaerolineales bacterium]